MPPEDRINLGWVRLQTLNNNDFNMGTFEHSFVLTKVKKKQPNP